LIDTFGGAALAGKKQESSNDFKEGYIDILREDKLTRVLRAEAQSELRIS
jgi:hypothetical protein